MSVQVLITTVCVYIWAITANT